MIDIKKYSELKTKGLATVISSNGADTPETLAYAVATKKFNHETGERLPDEMVGISRKELDDKKIALEAEVAAIEAFIADAELAPIK